MHRGTRSARLVARTCSSSALLCGKNVVLGTFVSQQCAMFTNRLTCTTEISVRGKANGALAFQYKTSGKRDVRWSEASVQRVNEEFFVDPTGANGLTAVPLLTVTLIFTVYTVILTENV